MGKSEVDLADDIDEINEHAEAIAAAAKRKEERGTNSARPPDAGKRHRAEGRDREVTDVGDRANGQGPLAKSAPELEVLEGKENGAPKNRRNRTRRPPKKSKHRTPSADRQLSVEDDPWVTESLSGNITLFFSGLPRHCGN